MGCVFVRLHCCKSRKGRVCAPLGLIGLKDLALGVIAQSANVDEAAQIELLSTEHGHDGRVTALATVDEAGDALRMSKLEFVTVSKIYRRNPGLGVQFSGAKYPPHSASSLSGILTFASGSSCASDQGVIIVSSNR